MIKRIATILLLLLINQPLWSGNNEEFRATWLITWDAFKSSYSAEDNKALARKILDNHVKANLNAVLWQCRQGGTAYYESSYEPWGYYLNYQHPGYDPLAYAVAEAHKRGMELHAWFNVFNTSSTYPGSPAAEHPEWVCRDQAGNPMTSSRSLSPGLAAVREYTLKVAMEIVRNYDIDGLHLDYVRWNEYSSTPYSRMLAKAAEQQPMLDGMIGEAQLKDLLENAGSRYLYDIEHPYSAGVPQGFSSWEEWWRWSVTEFVRVLHDSIQAVKPWVRLSAAALGNYNWGGWQGYGTVYQDAALWFNEGYIDQLTPMHYHWATYQGFYDMLVGSDGNSTSATCWGKYIQQGIADGRLFSTGPSATDLDPVKPQWRNPVPLVAASRAVPWVDGSQFFSYGDWRDWNYFETARKVLYPNKTKIRATKLIVSSLPDAPAILLAKIDSFHYQITVTPPSSIASDHRFAIYRSADNFIDVASDEIVDVHFGRDSYSFIDSFDGLQDYNGAYFYAATALDRYWNESAISNAVQSDPIPSLAPTILATDPADGDTIAVNKPIIFYFSKTMNTSTFAGAITITPAVEIEQFIWNAADKSLTLDVKGNFAFDTNYIITIRASAADINGRSLDGNADGIEGDPFVLHFTTRAVDDIGPIVIFTNPCYQTTVESVDVEDVFTFVFDELINPKSIYDSTIMLLQKDQKIKIDILHSIISDHSLIDLKPFESLLPETDCSLRLKNTITDTAGNQLASDLLINFKTSAERYIEKKMIDDFLVSGYWQQPSYSGSTSGIVVVNTTFDLTRNFYLPASWTSGLNKRCAYLNYQWMETPPPEGYLLREYLSTGPPRDVVFDTSYTLQCYVSGDRSMNKFRFCIDEGDGVSWPYHEVSQWITIDWYGWKLLEWKLSDPNSVGSWIGNGKLDGKAYRIDSFQLTHDNNGAISGKLYFDNLRLAKKSTAPLQISDRVPSVASTFQLYQNYPNPFNPVTTISFDIPKSGKVIMKIFDMLGRSVATLIDETLEAGHHEVQFDGTRLSSGIYFYRLEFDGQVKNRSMVLIK